MINVQRSEGRFLYLTSIYVHVFTVRILIILIVLCFLLNFFFPFFFLKTNFVALRALHTTGSFFFYLFFSFFPFLSLPLR